MPRIFLFQPTSDNPLKGPLNLLDGQTVPVDLIVYDNNPIAAQIEYTIARNGEVQTGYLMIAFDGTETSLTDTNIDTAAVLGIQFDASFDVNGNLIIRYTSSVEGFPATMTYFDKVWR